MNSVLYISSPLQHSVVERRKSRRKLLFASVLLGVLASVPPCPVFANPTGGTITAGNASISSSGSTLTVTQLSNSAVIDWRGFDIAQGETTNFVQPSSNAITLNRVNSPSASLINGALNANGNIVIVNQNGVLFGKNAHVNVNSLLVTTADIDSAQFMAGHYAFNKPGNPNATIQNEGTITAKQAGLVGFVAPNVLNDGIIAAKLGTIRLASGDTFTIDLYGDNLMSVQASPALQSQLVSNTGKLKAAGGTIALTAAAAAQAVNSLITVSGELDAPAIAQKNGSIYIFAEGSNAVQNNVTANKGQKTGSSTVLVTGKLNVSSKHGSAGAINILADTVKLTDTAKIDANGATGGGSVNIGGQAHGTGFTPTALTTIIEAGAFITANATQIGNGGTVTVWSDQNTIFNGSILAQGGVTGGNGGFVETSSRGTLELLGTVSASAAHGSAGQWLLDPSDILIVSGSGTDLYASASSGTWTPTAGASGSFIYASNINSTLAGGTSVTVDTASTGSGTGNITLINGANVSTTGGASLTLNAANTITLNGTISMGSGALTFNAVGGILGGGNISSSGSVIFNPGAQGTYAGNITGSTSLTLGGAGTLILTGTNSYTGATTINSGVLSLGSISAINGASAITVNSGGTLNVAGINTTLGTGATITFNNGSTLSGTGSLTVPAFSQGVMVTMNGDVAINGSTGLTFNITNQDRNSTSLYLASGADITTTGVVTLDLVGTGSSGTNHVLQAPGAVTINAASGSLTVDVTPTAGDNGAQWLGNPTFGGNITFNVASNNGDNAFSSDSYPSITLLNNATLNVNVTGGTAGYALPTGGVTWTLGSDATVNVTGSASIQWNGTWNLTGGTVNIYTPLIVQADATIDNAGTINVFGGIGTHNNAKMTFDGGGTTTLSGGGYGGGGITINGSSTLILSGTNTYDNPTVVNSGVLELASVGAINGNSSITINSGATLDIAGVNTAFGNGSVLNLNDGSTLTGTGSLTVPVNEQGTAFIIGGNVAINGGAGFVINAGNNDRNSTSLLLQSGTVLTTTGIVTFNLTGTGSNGSNHVMQTGGAVTINASSGLLTFNITPTTGDDGAQFNGTPTFGGAVTFNTSTNNNVYGFSSDSATNITLLDNATLNVNITAAGSASYAIATSGFTWTLGTGSTVNVTGPLPVLWSGAWNITGGTVNIQTPVNLTSDITLNDPGTLNVSGLLTTINNAKMAFAGGGTTTLSGGGFTGTGSLTLNDGGTAILGGTNTYSGVTTINNGTLKVTSDTAIEGATSITVNSGGVFNLNGTNTTLAAGGALNLNDGSTLTGSGSFTLPAVSQATMMTMNGNVAINGGSGLTFNITNQDSLSRALLMQANTNLTTTGIVTFNLTGTGTNVSNHTLQTAGAVTINASSGLLTFNVSPPTDDDGAQWNGGVTFGGAVTFNIASGLGGIYAFSGDSSPNLTLLANAALTVNTTSNNATPYAIFTGGSTWTLGSGAVVNVTGSAPINWTGTWDITGGTVNIETPVSITSDVTIQNAGTLNVSGAISGSNALTFTGGGISTLSGANTFTGNSTISSGTVVISGSLNIGTSGIETVSIASGSTLSGSGAITAGTLNISGAGTVDLTGNNIIGGISVSGTVGALTLNDAQSFAVNSITATGPIALSASGATSDFTLNSGAVLTSSATGAAVTLSAGRNFINNAGSNAIDLTGTGSPNWLVYSATPSGDTFGSLNSNNTAIWNTLYGGTISQTGDRYVFAYKPTITFTTTNDSKNYGASQSVANDYTISGLLSGVSGVYLADTNTTAFSGTPTVTSVGSAASANVAGGPYTISLTHNLTGLDGYTIAYNSTGQLSVNPVSLTITANDANMTYGATNLPNLSASYTGFVNNDTSSSLTTSPTFTTAATTYNGTAGSASNVGTYAITASGAVDSNYTISYVAGTMTIGKANLTITANNANMTYGAASLPALSASYSGLVNGDNIGSLATSPTLTTAATAYNGTAGSGSNAGTYTIAASGAADSNYTISYVDGTMTVNKANLTITANNANMTYGATSLPVLSAAYNGLVNGDTGSSLTTTPALTTTATINNGTAGSGSNVGTYGITAGGAVSDNYTISYVDGTMTVNKANLTIAADNQSVPPGGTLPNLTASYSGFVNGDTASNLATAPTVVSATSATANAGTYIGTLTASGAADNNYTISYVAGDLTIQSAPVVTSQPPSTTIQIPSSVKMVSQNPVVAFMASTPLAAPVSSSPSTNNLDQPNVNFVSSNTGMFGNLFGFFDGEVPSALLQLFGLTPSN